MGFLLLITGLLIFGGSIYKLYGDKLMSNMSKEASHELDAVMASGRHLNLSKYNQLPLPISVKPFLIAITLAIFGACLYTIYYLVNYSETVAGKFWLFMLIIGIFGFGCYFVSLVGKADEKFEQKQKRITSINSERMLHRQQAVHSAYLELEEEKKAQLRQIELNQAKKAAENREILIQNERDNFQIIANLKPTAEALGVTTDTVAVLNTQKAEATIQIKTFEEIEKIKTQNEYQKDLNTAKIEDAKQHNTVNLINRTQYRELSDTLHQDILNLEIKIEETRINRSI